MRIDTVPIENLKHDTTNPRKHGKRNLESIVSSLKTFGQQKPIVVQPDGTVIAGNGTLEAARTLGWDTIAVVYSDLEGKDADGFKIADNRSGELAEWDAKVLLELDVDLQSLSFSEGDIAELEEMIEPAEGGSGGGGGSSGSGGRAMSKLPTVRMVFAFRDLAEFERAISATGKMNRSEAILELCRNYAHTKRQLDIPAETAAATPSPGPDSEPAADRARKPRRARQAV